MHTPAEIGIDDFQSSRPPDQRYRTTPLAGLFTRQKGGFYHDGRYGDLRAVVEHYNQALNLNLSEQAKKDLVEYLKSLKGPRGATCWRLGTQGAADGDQRLGATGSTCVGRW